MTVLSIPRIRKQPINFKLYTKSLKYGGLQHVGILVNNTAESKKFYIQVFGFEDETELRPKTLPYPGAFLRCGSDQIHLMELPSMDPKDGNITAFLYFPHLTFFFIEIFTEGRPAHGGRDRHVALTVNDIDILKARLESEGVTYTVSQGGRRAIFCRDLDGNAYEFMESLDLNNE